ncbi:MAG TPA: hypothetical protein VHZ32_09410 [Rhizomicrobium sp.]|nr:hypothetical protein [Rhizomicrobium sp.]
MFRTLSAVAVLTIACAPLAQAQDASLSPGQQSVIDRACARVMGLKPGETYFARCRESLSQALPLGGDMRPLAVAYADIDNSFYEVSPAIRWDREQQACAQIGLRPGSTPFHQCAAALDGAFLPSPN